MIGLDKGLVKLDWNDIENISDSDISYFLALEGKSVEAICKIRKLEREEVQKHIIEGKIKYRHLVKSRSEEELFKTLCNTAKQDKLAVLSSLNEESRERLVGYIKKGYSNMESKSKETALWIIGELKSKALMDILMKSIVHKHVNIRRMAASALGKLEDKAGETALLRALDDDNAQVVQYAIKSLTKIKSQRALEKVRNIYVSADKDYLRKAAEEYIIGFNDK
ncbi:HEAT repeat domain-containing protein [Clostridium swellfunianum]|uniref:HEAT repeat domain-containing protein n=1 Tax=Clostridium swellfunianum TaxID=1367462 RepID=UPI0032D5A2D6